MARELMERVRFETADAVVLEGEIRHPEGQARASAVLCHPHPQHGGSKDHPLLWAIRNELAHRGTAVVSFNFRGVMGSGGSYTGGVNEVEDVRAAIARAREAAPGPTLVAGWSFGANVALREALPDDRVAALALVGMPLGESYFALPSLPERSELAAFDRPVLLVAGAADSFCPVPELRLLARRLPRSETLVIDHTDHFFWRREGEVARAIGEFAERSLPLGERALG